MQADMRVASHMDNKAHGGHIAALILSGFQIVAPELVKRGYFSVVVPPYYRIIVGKNEENRMYIRGRRDLPQWCAKKILYPTFSLKVRYREDLNLPDKILSEEEFSVLTEILFNYGLLIDNISTELAVVPELLEALCRCTHYLTPETMQTGPILEATGADQASYDAFTNTLILTFLDEDIPIPLYYLRDRIYGPILRTLNRLSWTLYDLYITTKRNQRLVDHPVTLYQLYDKFRECRDALITIEPLKGLGSMTQIDLTKTCLDPRNRRCIQIRSLGDVQRVINLMEKNSAARQQLSESSAGRAESSTPSPNTPGLSD